MWMLRARAVQAARALFTSHYFFKRLYHTFIILNGKYERAHLEVHMRDCEWAHRIAYRNRDYYCDLERALADGFDGCAYCLPQHHSR